MTVGVLVSWLTEVMQRSVRRAEQARRRTAEMEACQREHELREAEAARLRRFTRDAPVGIVFGRADGGIHLANDEYLRIIGASREELESGQVRWDRITPPEWQKADKEAIAALSPARSPAAPSP